MTLLEELRLIQEQSNIEVVIDKLKSKGFQAFQRSEKDFDIYDNNGKRLSGYIEPNGKVTIKNISSSQETFNNIQNLLK